MQAVQRRHPNAYHPWGFATRACIGSQFALFEAKCPGAMKILRCLNAFIVLSMAMVCRSLVALRTFLASMLLHFRLQGIPGYKLVASSHAGGAAPSPHELAFQAPH